MAFEFERVILYWVNKLSFISRSHLQKRFREAGEKIGPEEWAVLMLLWKCDNRAPSDLADATIRDRTTMTRLIDTMVKKGLVTRKPDDQDRRRVLVQLTDRGQQLQNVLVPVARGLIGDALEGIDPAEIEIAIDVLKKISINLLDQENNL